MRALLAVLTAVLLAACGGGGATSVTAADSGSRVDLAVGDVLEVALESNPSTGYDWHVAELDANVLAPAGDPVHEPDSALAGAGGVSTWRFEAVGSGRTTLRLVYERSWEDVPPEATFELIVQVVP